jgi:small conductance mechanosensitive channel
MYLPMQLPGVNGADIERADSLLRSGIEHRVQVLAEMTWGERFHLLAGDLWHVGLKIVVAIAIIVVGRWIVRHVGRGVGAILEKWKVDPSLRTFIRSATKIFLYLVLFYLVITWLGVNTSLFVALFAAAGLAIGMAMSGVFQNIAGGVTVLMLKPFKCGDWIELQGQAGRVMDIRLFNTVLRTADNRTILFPNGSVSTSVVCNHTAARTRRLEWPVSLDLNSDFEAARRAIMELLVKEKRINTFPVPEVVLNQITSDSIDLLARGWVATNDYWDVYFGISAAIFKALSEKGFDMGTLQALKVTLQPPEA